MAKIEAKSIWKDGQNQNVDQISIHIVHDDLISNATFYYRMFGAIPPTEEGGEVTYGPTVSEGNVSISGEDYDTWGESANVNAAAYEYVCNKLGLVLVA